MTVPLSNRITSTPACEAAGLTPVPATPVLDDLFATLMDETSDGEKTKDTGAPPQDGIIEAAGADDVGLMWPLLAVAAVMPHPTAPQPGVSVAIPQAGGARDVSADAASPKAVKPGSTPARDMDARQYGEEPAALPEDAVVVESATHRPPSPPFVQMSNALPSTSGEAENPRTFTISHKDNVPDDKTTLPSAGREIEAAKADLASPLMERDTALGTASESVAIQVASSLREALASSDSGQARAMPGADLDPAWSKAQLRILDVVLKPEHLGRIEIKMKLAGDGLSIMLTPQTEKARHLLEGQLDSLKDSLTAAGYDLTAIGIEHAPSHDLFAESRRDHGATPGASRDSASASAETAQGHGRQERRNAGYGRQDQSAARRSTELEQPSIRPKPGVYV